MCKILFCSILLSTTLSFAQLGPSPGPPSIFSTEILSSGHKEPRDGVASSVQGQLGIPLYKSDDFFLISTLTYQNIKLEAAPFSFLPHTDYQSVNFNLIGNIHSQKSEGWLWGSSFGSASDDLFANSRVLSYNFFLQRRNDWGPRRTFSYGFFYSNNGAILPGLPIPSVTYEMKGESSEDFVRIGFPFVVRYKTFLPQTRWGMFAVGPVIWDVFLQNRSLLDYQVTFGVQKKPDVFLLSQAVLEPPLRQLMVDQMSIYMHLEWMRWKAGSLGVRAVYNFNNRFRLREIGTVRDEYDQKRQMPDYGFLGLSFKVFVPNF